MSWRFGVLKKTIKIERLENGYVLAEAAKSPEKRRIQRRPRISTKEFPVFYRDIFLCGSFAGLNRAWLRLVLLRCRQADIRRVRFESELEFANAKVPNSPAGLGQQ